MLKQTLFSVANAIWYLLTRRHLLEGRYDEKTGRYRNWDGSYTRIPGRFERPGSLDELAEIIRGAKRVSVVGAGHSFNDIHLNDEVLVSLDRIAGNISYDAEAMTATFHAGTRMRDVNEFIQPLGLALPLLPDHNAQSIGGVLATDVHATARRGSPGYISEYVTALKIMDGKGEVHTAEKGSPHFRSAIGGMGCTGLIVEATFQAVPIFKLKVPTFTVSIDELLENLDNYYEEFDHFGAGWIQSAGRVLVEAKRRTDEKESFMGPFREDVAQVTEAIALSLLLPLTVNFGAFGKWLGGTALKIFMYIGDWTGTDLVHTSWEGFNRNVYHLHKEVEFACSPEGAREVYRQAKEVFDSDPNHSYYVLGIRRTRANPNTMIGPGSGAADQELCWMAPHLVDNIQIPKDEAIWRKIIESVDGRPHNGKNMLGIKPEYIVAHQPEWNDFLALVEEMDPEHKLTNDLVRATLPS